MSTLKRLARTARTVRGLRKSRERQKHIKLSMKPVVEDADYWAQSEYRFKITKPSKPNQEVIGSLSYYPDEKKVYVGGIFTTKLGAKRVPPVYSAYAGETRRRTVKTYTAAAHKQVALKSLSSTDVRKLIREIAKRFPKADIVEGLRESGMRTRGGASAIQMFDLSSLRRRMKSKK